MEPKPTVGRQVHFFRAGSKEPLAATVAKVWSETMLNLCVIDENGTPSGRTSIGHASVVGESNEHWAWPARV